MDYRGNNADKLFAETVLGATMASDDAEVEQAYGQGVLAGIEIDFSFAAGSMYHVEYPDVLSTSREVVLKYSNGGAAASLGDNVFFMGFPFEAIGSAWNDDEADNELFDEEYTMWLILCSL